MIKTITKIRSLREKMGNELILVDLATGRKDLGGARRQLASLGNTCEDIQEIVKQYLMFGEEE